MKNLLLYPFRRFRLFFSKFAGPVDKSISTSYYYGKSAGDIYYSPMGNWFALGCTKMDADKTSFRPVSYDFGKDKDFVYYKDTILPSADPATFVVEDSVIKDHKNVYAEKNSKVIIVEKADPSSFKYIREQNPYSATWGKDDGHYFLYNEAVDVDYESFRLLKNGMVADKNFVYKIGYTEDESSIWSHRPILEKADVVSGEIQEINSIYMVMNHCVYCNNDEFIKISFDLISHIRTVDEECVIINETLLAEGRKFPYEAVDVSTYKRFLDSKPIIYSKDKNHIYCQGQVVTGADLETFEPLGGGYAKDQNQVYYFDSVVDGASPDTFNLDKKTYQFMDGKTEYVNGKPFKIKH